MFAAPVPVFEMPAAFQLASPALLPAGRSPREAIAAVAEALAEPSVSEPSMRSGKKRARDVGDDNSGSLTGEKPLKRTLKCSNLGKLGDFAEQLEQGVPLLLVVERCFAADASPSRRRVVGRRAWRQPAKPVLTPGDRVNDEPEWFPLGV